MKSFNTVILHCGGNDASNGIDIELFEEKYDQLVGLVKTGNPASNVLLCKVAPRGDVDVTDVNSSISRLAAHWKDHKVQCIAETHDLFYGKDDVPQARFYNQDSIHLSRSGIKRFVSCIHRHIDLVHDYNRCVFVPRPHSGGDHVYPGNQNTRDQWSAPFGQFRQQLGRKNGYRNSMRAPRFNNANNMSAPRFNNANQADLRIIMDVRDH